MMAIPLIGLSEDGNTITLHKLREEMFTFPHYFTLDWAAANADKIQLGAAIDVETTGLDPTQDKIIEIGLRIFKYNRITGDILSLDTVYESLQDPGVIISDKITALTGINDEMVKGKMIDWSSVNTLLSNVQIIISHHASFDRAFVDKHSSTSETKIWGCSLTQINWEYHGLPSAKLDVLSVYHGVFTNAHRALNDTTAFLYLLSLNNTKDQTQYLLELVNNANKTTILVSAENPPFGKNELLKARNYRFDFQNKIYRKEIDENQRESETQWLEDIFYEGPSKAHLRIIQPLDRFKK